MMDEFLNKLIKHDTKLSCFTQDQQIIHQGLAPLLALSNNSVTIQKANLLETLKLKNWLSKSKVLFNELSANKIEFLVFKGFAFTHLLYNMSQFRPYSDIDIIINKSDYESAKDILIKLNYQQYPSRQGAFVSFQNSFYNDGSPQAVIDLHWEINNRIEFHQHYGFASLFAYAQTLDFGDTEFKTLSNIDAFILGCFHYQAHRPEDRKHIWLYDLALLWNKMDDVIQSQCLTKAKQTKQSAIVINTLELLNLTFSNCFMLDLQADVTNNEATNFYLQQRNIKLADITTRLKNIQGLNNKIKFLGEYIFQNKEYVQQRFGLQNKQWVYLYYPKMWLQDITKLFK